jgi:hypothetical protein
MLILHEESVLVSIVDNATLDVIAVDVMLFNNSTSELVNEVELEAVKPSDEESMDEDRIAVVDISIILLKL